MTSQSTTSLEFAIALAQMASQTRCENVVVLDVRGHSQVTEFFVIATGTSVRQMRTVGDELAQHGKNSGFTAYRQSGYEGAKWILVDFVSVVAHIFDAPSRAFYDLELLWGDCPRIDWKLLSGFPGETQIDEVQSPQVVERPDTAASQQPLADAVVEFPQLSAEEEEDSDDTDLLDAEISESLEPAVESPARDLRAAMTDERIDEMVDEMIEEASLAQEIVIEAISSPVSKPVARDSRQPRGKKKKAAPIPLKRAKSIVKKKLPSKRVVASPGKKKKVGGLHGVKIAKQTTSPGKKKTVKPITRATPLRVIKKAVRTSKKSSEKRTAARAKKSPIHKSVIKSRRKAK